MDIFFTCICCKNCNDVCLKIPKINDKRDWRWPIFKNTDLYAELSQLVTF